jgi:hypothetical protein
MRGGLGRYNWGIGTTELHMVGMVWQVQVWYGMGGTCQWATHSRLLLGATSTGELRQVQVVSPSSAASEGAGEREARQVSVVMGLLCGQWCLERVRLGQGRLP